MDQVNIRIESTNDLCFVSFFYRFSSSFSILFLLFLLLSFSLKGQRERAEIHLLGVHATEVKRGDGATFRMVRDVTDSIISILLSD